MQTILVIDDDDSLRDTIGLMVENEGFKSVLVADGSTGLEQAFALRPNLIPVDLRMPGLSGVEVCKRLRAAGLKTPSSCSAPYPTGNAMGSRVQVVNNL
jgi:CheY-like chemotaxis protein